MIDKLRFLPPQLYAALSRLDGQKVYEIRLRADKPARVCFGGRFYYLTENGLADIPFPNIPSAPLTVKCSATQIAEIVLRAAEFSIYAFNGQISGGYITISGGIRIGVAGEVVYEGDKIKTQKNFGSLVIRIPHEITGCADRAYKSIIKAKNKNSLILSPPGCGKTTILRDLSRQISDSGFNTLLVDERSELAACQNGVPRLSVGINTDVISNAQKDYAFSFGIRSLRPDYIITDELGGEKDLDAVKKAALSGVNVIASIHASGIGDLKGRREFAPVFADKIFGRYIVLSSSAGVGTYENILDETLTAVSVSAV